MCRRRSRRPTRQGFAAVMEVFIISFLTSSISALSILVTGVWRSGLTSTAAVAPRWSRRNQRAHTHKADQGNTTNAAPEEQAGAEVEMEPH